MFQSSDKVLIISSVKLSARFNVQLEQDANRLGAAAGGLHTSLLLILTPSLQRVAYFTLIHSAPAPRHEGAS